MGRFDSGLALAIFAVVGVYAIFKIFASIHAELESAKHVNTPDLLQKNPRLARNLRLLSEMRMTLLWCILGVIAWVIFLYFALNYGNYEVRMPPRGA